ncbi:hypothetical protein ABZV67_33045 [Streptomyces sp. NPDC005065]|uniref:hypothetical protein n=1 Tax=Streptomyces sp. NPDC005065 TaxID=3154461 RepID=UPI0033B43519
MPGLLVARHLPAHRHILCGHAAVVSVERIGCKRRDAPGRAGRKADERVERNAIWRPDQQGLLKKVVLRLPV